MHLSAEQSFKVAFIGRCADAGMSPAEMARAADRLSAAVVKAAGAADTALNAAGLGLTALAVAPPALGAAAGWGLAKATDVDDTDVGDVKRQETIDEYLRQAARLRNEAAARAQRHARRPAGRVLL